MFKKKYIPIKSKIRNGPKKGDLIITHGYHWKSRLIRYFTGYYENHVCIITQGGTNAKLMHSDGNGTYEEDLFNYINNYDGFVGYRPLTKKARIRFNKKIDIFNELVNYKKKNPGHFDLKNAIKVGIFHQPIEQVMKLKLKNDSKNNEVLFCSQFITIIYQKVGLFPKHILPQLLSPGAVAKGLWIVGTTEKETIWLNELKK